MLVLSVTDNHHHLPVCCGCTAALHAVSATGWSSYPQTWPLHPAAAQWGGFWGNHSNIHIAYVSLNTYSVCIFIYFSVQCKVLKLSNQLNWLNLFLFFGGVCSGDASTGGERPGQRKHSAGAGWGSTAALEKAGSGTAQDCFWPPQNA